MKGLLREIFLVLNKMSKYTSLQLIKCMTGIQKATENYSIILKFIYVSRCLKGQFGNMKTEFLHIEW